MLPSTRVQILGPGKVKVAMKRTISLLILVLFVSLSLVSPTPFRSRAQTSKSAATRGQQTAPGDRAWPRGYNLSSEAQIVIYQPQVVNWDKQTHMIAMAAVSYFKKDDKKPTMGTIK